MDGMYTAQNTSRVSYKPQCCAICVAAGRDGFPEKDNRLKCNNQCLKGMVVDTIEHTAVLRLQTIIKLSST